MKKTNNTKINNKAKRVKALVLFSGGLDSILTVKLLQEQGIEVVALSFTTPFFNADNAKKSAKELGIDIMVKDFTSELLPIVKDPIYGHGKNMNPCIDCHGSMLKKAKSIMKSKGFDFVATGEVLNERPMSQTLKGLQIVEKMSELNGYLLRPLSAKLLPETIIEVNKIVNRDKLESIEGRSRHRQYELANKYKIKFIPTPAGGCLLTDENFSQKLNELLSIIPDADKNDLDLLKYGRHFWLDLCKIVIGRNNNDNKQILKLAKTNDIILSLVNYPGPDILIRCWAKDKINSVVLKKAGEYARDYSAQAKSKKNVTVKYKKIGQNKWEKLNI